jgi:DNA-directed RNA polymerase subunit RPC12/RpoP
MKIKKFTCYCCGAPKVEQYKNPYIMCDFCGSLMDFDYSKSLDLWKHDAAVQYGTKSKRYLANSKKFLEQRDRKNYFKEQYELWDNYYTSFPLYLPPTVSGEKDYPDFINALAEMATVHAFNPPPADKLDAYTKAYTAIKYEKKDGKKVVIYSTLMEMMDAMKEYTAEYYQEIYSNPIYEAYQEMMPEPVNMKIQLSQMVQQWMPQLDTKDAARFLKELGLSQEFLEIGIIAKTSVECTKCKKAFEAPQGAIRCSCPHCNHKNIIQKVLSCASCGAENEIPRHLKKVIDCHSCGTELRVVQPLFG